MEEYYDMQKLEERHTARLLMYAKKLEEYSAGDKGNLTDSVDDLLDKDKKKEDDDE